MQNFEQRANKLRTRKEQMKQQLKEKKTELTKEGLTREEYWEKNVKDPQSCLGYFQLYYPEYPPQLQEAMAKRIVDLIQRGKDNQLTEEDMIVIEKSKQVPPKWDYEQELKEEMMKGKIQLAMKRLSEL